MSTTYHGRRAPNVSQYLANLNTIPTHEQLASEINLGEGDLDFLTNAEFFDFDSFHPNAAAAAAAAAVEGGHYNSHNHSQHHSPRDGKQTLPALGLGVDLRPKCVIILTLSPRRSIPIWRVPNLSHPRDTLQRRSQCPPRPLSAPAGAPTAVWWAPFWRQAQAQRDC